MASLWESFLTAPDYTEDSPWFPNPLICARDMTITGFKEVVARIPWNGWTWMTETWFWVSQCHYTDPSSIVLPLFLCVLLTLLRIFLNWLLFRRIPKWVDMTEEAADKFPESFWKFVYYSCTWTFALYILVSAKDNMFFKLQRHWDVWHPQLELEPSIYWLYMIQMGFYLHCLYASIYLETIRRDFYVLLIHHVLTLSLLYFSYIIRFHYIGLMLLFTLDIGDVFLELSKTVFYLKDRGHRKNPWTEMMANVCFACFTIQHILCRLYWYPTKLAYSAMHVSVTVYPRGPYYMLFVPLIWALYAMQVYWFKFIVRLLWKILVLGEDLEDTREYDENNINNKEKKKE